MKDLLEANAAKIRELYAGMQKTIYQRDKSEDGLQAWEEACARYRQSYDSLAFPGGYQRALVLLKAGDLTVAETAVTFCEVRPYFFSIRVHTQQTFTPTSPDRAATRPCFTG